jgi:hypothetical protein
LGSLAGPLAALGRPKAAARLLGASNAQLETLGADQQPADQFEIKKFIEDVRALLGDDEFSKAWAEGQKMTTQEAAQYALQDHIQ